MLRTLVAALLLANLLFFAWSQGWLARAIGSTPYSEREPQRLGAQVRPETVRVLPVPAAGEASAPASTGLAAPPTPASAPAPASAEAAAPPASAASAASAPA